jgi:hypothetical protein
MKKIVGWLGRVVGGGGGGGSGSADAEGVSDTHLVLPHTGRRWLGVVAPVLKEWASAGGGSLAQVASGLQAISGRKHVRLDGLENARPQTVTRFLAKNLKYIAAQALKIEHLFPHKETLKLLLRGETGTRSFTREQCCCLLANMWCLTFRLDQLAMHMPTNTFAQLLANPHEPEVAKLEMLLQ